MKTLLTVYTVAFLLALTGCGKVSAPAITIPGSTGTTPAASPVAAADPTPVPSASPTPESSGSDPTVTYYTASILLYTRFGATDPPGGTPVYGSGSCAVYSGNTYCWDDGLHGLNPGADFTFFEANQGLNFCRGNCQDDTFATPLLVDANVQAFNDLDAGTMPNRAIHTVLTTGTPTTVNCTLDSSLNVVCPNFTIDINQTPL